MTHARRQVIDQVITTLTGATGAGANVFSTRIYVIDPPADGAIYVTYTADTVAEEEDVMAAPPLHVHLLQVEVQIHARDTVTIDEDLDALAASAEAALGADCTLGGLCEKFTLSDSTLQTDGDGDAPHGLLTLTYTAMYRVAADDPETIIP